MIDRSVLKVAASIGLAVLSACGGGGGGTTQKTDQAIENFSITPGTLKLGATAIASATATSNLAVSFQSSTPSTCVTSGVNDSSVRGIAAGLCTVTATQAGNDGFKNATNQSRDITIAPIVYDATVDFSGTANPNGVWSYGWMPTDFSTFTFSEEFLNSYAVGWNGGLVIQGGIWKNVGVEVIYGVLPGQLSLHPGVGYEAAALRWTAPLSGKYTVVGRFLSGDINSNILVGVRQGSSSIWQGTDAGSFDLDVSLDSGTSLDFVVYGSYYFGNTPIELTITAYRLNE